MFPGRKRKAQLYANAVYRLACIQIQRSAKCLLHRNAIAKKKVGCAARDVKHKRGSAKQLPPAAGVQRGGHMPLLVRGAHQGHAVHTRSRTGRIDARQKARHIRALGRARLF